MNRLAVFLAALLVVAAVVLWFTYSGELMTAEASVASTRYDVDADGQVELVRWVIGESVVLWRWDRDADGQPELVAYDAVVGPDGSIRTAGHIVAWDWGGNAVLDAGEVPASVQQLLRSKPIAAQLAAPSSGDLVLVGPDIKSLVAEFRSGYDEWRLAGFRTPIVGASLPDLDTLLPSAPRAYRNGVHQGFDFMPGHIGAPTGYSGPAVAAKAGTVTRADLDFVEMTPREYDEAIETAKTSGGTPPDVLDKLRGRQVWIDHGHGVMTRYCHLSGVAAGVVVGRVVEARDIIGFVGNSGIEAGVLGGRADAHLHFELRIDDRYLGEGNSPDEIRAIGRRIFGLSEPLEEQDR